MKDAVAAFDPSLRRHARELRSGITLVLLISGAVIGALVTDLGRHWPWLVVAAVGSLLALLLHEHVASVEKRVRRTDATAAVEQLLAATCHALSTGARRKGIALRAFCHRDVPARKVLEPYGTPFELFPTADRHESIPYDEPGCEVIVIVQAFLSREPQLLDLPGERSDFERTHRIPQLGCVLAAPIIGADHQVLGTVSFDSQQPAAIAFPRADDARAAAFRLADAIACIWGES